MLSLVLAWLAGVVTVAAPCTLPMLPILLGASVGQTGKVRPAMIAAGFVMSFSVTALALGVATRLFDFDPGSLRAAATVLLLGFGLLMIWPAPFEWLSIRLNGLIGSGSAGISAPRPGNLGGFVLGTTLGLVWTPCAGPVLGSILTVIATSKDAAWASALLVVYAIGAAIPMLAIAYGGQAVTTRVRSVAAISPRLQQGFGAAVIAFAIASWFQYDTLIVSWLTDFIRTASSASDLTSPPNGATMTKRFLTATASVLALGLIGAGSLSTGSEAARDRTAPVAVAAAESPAPDFTGIGKWFNSAPLTIPELRGKVVLVNFWTYGCVNCINALPHVVALNAKYQARGLVVVGVHTPEFPFERSAANVQAALKRHGITYPVAQDNDFKTWNAWRNQYWPAQYIIDQNGKIVFQHAGEGQYEQIDRTVAALLNANS